MKTIKTIGNHVCNYLAPAMPQKMALFVLALAVFAVALSGSAYAQTAPGASVINYNTDRFGEATATLFGWLEGSFGALVMVVAGLGAIMSSAFGQYRAALNCLVVAVGAFILRSIVNTFFVTSSIPGFDGN